MMYYCVLLRIIAYYGILLCIIVYYAVLEAPPEGLNAKMNTFIFYSLPTNIRRYKNSKENIYISLYLLANYDVLWCIIAYYCVL